jgi:hypothetical protein
LGLRILRIWRTWRTWRTLGWNGLFDSIRVDLWMVVGGREGEGERRTKEEGERGRRKGKKTSGPLSP